MSQFVPLRARRAFADSSAYLALLDRKDAYHNAATEIVTALADRGYRQFTTNTLLVEAHALILSTLGAALALQFLHDMRQSQTVVVRVRQSDEERAERILARYADKDFSFADAISFAVMERLGISLAFTFDHHFAQFGYAVLAAEVLRTILDEGESEGDEAQQQPLRRVGIGGQQWAVAGQDIGIGVAFRDRLFDWA